MSIHGQPKTAFAQIINPIAIGDFSFDLVEVPSNWEVGDHIVIAGNRLAREESATFQIVDIEGTNVSIRDASHSADTAWSGVDADYTPNQDNHNFAVNLTRNVAISSLPMELSGQSAQGALVFRGQGVDGAQLHNLAFYGLGMQEGEVDGFATTEVRNAVTFIDGIENPAQVSGLILVDAPESSLTTENASIQVSNSAAFGGDGGAWLTNTGHPNQLLWSAERSTPKALRGTFGKGLLP